MIDDKGMQILKYENLNYSCIIVLPVVLLLFQHGLVFRLLLLLRIQFQLLLMLISMEEVELDRVIQPDEMTLAYRVTRGC